VWELKESGGVWTKTIIHAFPAATGDGQGPNSDIVFDGNGNLYGTTYSGGNSNYGIVFELSPPTVAGGAWTETILHRFTGTSTDGGYPIGGLLMHTFAGAEDGATPATTMALDPKGNLYGTTGSGTWTETILDDWGNSGQNPGAP